MKKLLLFTMTMIAQLGAMAQWAVFPLTAVDISCGSATQFATIRGSGGLWRYNFGTSAYESLNSGTYNFNGVSICADGTLIGKSTNTLSSTSNLVKYNTIPPAFNAFTAISGILNNNICALSNSFAVGSTGGSVNNNIYQWNGSAWSLLPGGTSISAKKVVVGGTSSDIYAMTWAATGNNVMAYNSGTWTAISNSTLNVTDISVGDAGKILAISGGQLYYRSAGAWVLDVTAPTSLTKVSAASDGTIMLLTSAAIIHRNTWANIICGTTSLPPVNTTASQNLTICSGQAATLTATGTGTLNWSGPSTGVGSTIVTPTLASTSTYSVTNTIGGCTALSLITVSVNPTPPAYSINPSSPICAGNTATLSYPTNCSWYSSPTSTNVIGSSYIFVTPTLTTNTTFYASVTSNGCESPRAVHTVTVKPLPNPPVYVSGNLSYCQGEFTIVYVDVASDWYSVPTGGNSPQNSIGFGINSNSNTTVYADVTVNGCTSFPRTAITVTVNPLPSVLSQTVQNSTCNGVPNGSIDLTLNNPSNYTYTWTPNVSTTNSATNIAAGVYTVAIEEAGCVLTQTYNVTQPAAYNVPVNVLANGTILGFGSMYTGSPSFQWVDCNNSNALIPGAVNATFTPTITGNYALTFGYSGCVNTSTCNIVTVTTTDLNENTLLNAISLQPNPASTFFTLSNVAEGTIISVIDVTGKVVISNSVIDTDKTMTIETSNFSNGIYVIQLENNGAVAHKKLIISN
jgi:hypothetical protein